MSSRIPESRSYAASQQAMAAQNNQAFAREHMRARSKVIMNLVFNILVGLVTFTTLPWQLAAGITAGTFILTALLGGFSVPEVVVVARRRFSSGQLLGGSQPSAPSQARRSFAAAAPQDAGLARRLPPASQIPGTNVVRQPVADGRPREEVGSGVSGAPHFVAARSAVPPASQAAPVVHAVAAPAGPQVVAPARPIPQSNLVLQPVAQPGPREEVGTGVSSAPHFVAARSALASASNAAPIVPAVVAPARPIPQSDAAPVSSARREAVGSGANRRGLGLAPSSSPQANESAARSRARPTSVQFARPSAPNPSFVLERSPLTRGTAPAPLSSARRSFWEEEGTGSPFALEGATPPIPRRDDMPAPPTVSLQQVEVSRARNLGTEQPAEPFLPPKPVAREPVGAGKDRNRKG